MICHDSDSFVLSPFLDNRTSQENIILYLVNQFSDDTTPFLCLRVQIAVQVILNQTDVVAEAYHSLQLFEHVNAVSCEGI